MSAMDPANITFSGKGFSLFALGIRLLFGGGRNSVVLLPSLLASEGRGGGLEAEGRRCRSVLTVSVRFCRGGESRTSGLPGRTGRWLGSSDGSSEDLEGIRSFAVGVWFSLRVLRSVAASRRASTVWWTGGGGK